MTEVLQAPKAAAAPAKPMDRLLDTLGRSAAETQSAREAAADLSATPTHDVLRGRVAGLADKADALLRDARAIRAREAA